MKKKNKVPLVLRIIPAVFPWIELLSGRLANQFFVYLFFTPINYAIPGKEKKAKTFAEKFGLHVGNKKIACYRWGNSDKSILVVHGWAGRATQFRRFVKPLLKEGYQVIGFDGPAHGDSEGRNTNLDEFKEVIQTLNKRYGNFAGIIAHSFGGVAALYAIANGTEVKTLVNIASPTIGDEIIKTYLKAIGGSSKTGESFKKFVIQKSGKTFEEFSSLELIKQVPAELNLLLVHDKDDNEVSLEHPRQLIQRFPQARLYETHGLGHTRILRDEKVIYEIVTFICAHSSDQ